MKNLCSEVLRALEGKRLVTAESLTGGGIGAVLTAVPGSSTVYCGGVISYTDEVKEHILGVPGDVLAQRGAVSAPAARAMAQGVRSLLRADVSVSVTGLAGPGGDDFGNPVGTVFIGYADDQNVFAREYHFEGNREAVRNQTIRAAMNLVLEQNKV